MLKPYNKEIAFWEQAHASEERQLMLMASDTKHEIVCPFDLGRWACVADLRVRDCLQGGVVLKLVKHDVSRIGQSMG